MFGLEPCLLLSQLSPSPSCADLHSPLDRGRQRWALWQGSAHLRKLRTHLSAGISVRLLTCFYRVEQQRNSHKRREKEKQQIREMGKVTEEQVLNKRTRQNPRSSKALRDDDKAWVTRTEPQDHRGGSDLCSLEHPPGGHLSPAWSRTQTATGSQEDSV